MKLYEFMCEAPFLTFFLALIIFGSITELVWAMVSVFGGGR
tara:strand:- start:264 stop:386 length:123 start_codon:yes stop_codon:yes gene_type:complete